MSWVAVAVGGAAVAGGTMGYFSGSKGKARDPYGTLNPEQVGLTKALGPYLQSQVGVRPSYGGQLTEQLGGAEGSAIARALAMQQSAGQGVSAATQPFTNEQFRTEISQPSIDFFRREIQPMLEESLPTFSTARANVLSRNLTGLQENLLQQRFAAREASKDRALRAAGIMPGIAEGITRTAAIPRELTQAGLDREYQDYIQGGKEQANSINQMLNFLGISTVTAEQPDTRMQSAMAGAFGGAQLGISGMSAYNANQNQKSFNDSWDKYLNG